MPQRSFVIRHGSVALAVVVSVGMLGIAPAHAATVPAAPVIVLATAGIATATANWRAPVNAGGSPITLYHVRMVDGATGRRALGLKDVASTATSLSFTGVPAGTQVRFQVQAKNAVGMGPVSAHSNAVTTATKPGAPRINTASAGAGSALGRWTAPASNGSAITKYHVRMVDGATGRKALALKDVAATVTSLSIIGLAKGTSVRFQVQAINAVGIGNVSAHSNAVTVLAAVAKPPGPVVYPKYVAPTIGPWTFDSCMYTLGPVEPLVSGVPVTNNLKVVVNAHYDVTGGAWEHHIPGFGIPPEKHWHGEKDLKSGGATFFTYYDPEYPDPDDEVVDLSGFGLWMNAWEPGSVGGTDKAHRLPLPPGGQIAVFAPGACQKVASL